MIFLDTCQGWTIVSAVAAMITAITAGFYTFYTYHLLAASRETLAKANSIQEFSIYKEISSALSNNEFIRLYDMCEKNSLSISYDNTGDNLLIINSDYLNRVLLNPFEDIAVFYERGLISINTIDAGFGYKILRLCNSNTISEHVVKIRARLSNVYSGLENLYARVIKIALLRRKKDVRSSLFKK